MQIPVVIHHYGETTVFHDGGGVREYAHYFRRSFEAGGSAECAAESRALPKTWSTTWSIMAHTPKISSAYCKVK